MLSGKTIIVTGAASGIGAESTREIRRQGGRVIAVDRNEPDREVDHFVRADLSSPATIDACIDQIGDGIDGLCNIAGVPPTAGAIAVIATNFIGLRYLTLGMIDHLNDGAAIVNLASLAGFGWPQAVSSTTAFMADTRFDNIAAQCERYDIDQARSYFLAKEALILWTMQNRWTWRKRGIRMNAISPGPVDTPILPDFLETLGDRAQQDMKIMDRAGLPTDIAPLVAFLCSDGSAWLRGSNICADGGLASHLLAQTHGF